MASTSASLSIFGRDPDLLLERREKRVEYVQYREEQCIAPLWKVGRAVRSRVPVMREHREPYLESVLSINHAYFEGRAFEDRVQGRYHKFDDEAERRVRETTADALSDAVGDLRALMAAHDEVLDALVEEDQANFEPKLFTATRRVLAEGWFPTLETYYYALDPGEYIAEGVERRKRRIEGEERRPGVKGLLQGPLFEALAPEDLDAIKGVDWGAPGKPVRFVNRLEDDFSFMIQKQRQSRS